MIKNGFNSLEFLEVGSGVEASKVISSGEMVNNFLIRGNFDGVGVEELRSEKVVILLNHEVNYFDRFKRGVLGNFLKGGVGRDYNVSKLVYDKRRGEIVEGEGFIKRLNWYNYKDRVYGKEIVPPVGYRDIDERGLFTHRDSINNLCSASLSEEGSFFDIGSMKGYKGSIYLTGEERGVESRGFAVNEEGVAYQIPGVGLQSHENIFKFKK